MTPEKSPVGGACGSEFQAFGGSHRAKLQTSSALAVDMNPGQKNVNATIWGFPKIRGTLLGVPIIRVIVYWGLYWGPLFRETTILETPEVGSLTLVGPKFGGCGCQKTSV